MVYLDQDEEILEQGKEHLVENKDVFQEEHEERECADYEDMDMYKESNYKKVKHIGMELQSGEEDNEDKKETEMAVKEAMKNNKESKGT